MPDNYQYRHEDRIHDALQKRHSASTVDWSAAVALHTSRPCARRFQSPASEVRRGSSEHAACVLDGHGPDESPHLRADLRPPSALPRPPPPIQTEAGPMPSLTTTRTSDHRGHTWRNVVQKNRSRRVSGGRARWRLSTASCCRKARTLRAMSARLQRKRGSPATSARSTDCNTS